MIMNFTTKLFQNGLSKLTRLYHATYSRNLLATNVAISVSCCFVGDILVQKLVEKQEKVSVRRLAAMTSWGILFGSGAHLWYTTMARSKIFASPHRQSLFYMICFCPIEDALFYTYTGYFEGQNTEEVIKEVEDKLLLTLLIDALVYYPLMYCNIRFVPVHLRVTVDSLFTVFYGFCFSYLKHREIDILMLKLNFRKKATSITKSE